MKKYVPNRWYREEGNKLGFIDTNNCVKVDSFNTGEKHTI